MMIKILFLAGNPKDTNSLRLDEEVRAIRERLRLSDLRDQFAVEQEWAVRVTDLQGLLLQHQPHVVHFSGHGSQAGEIILEDVRGQSKPVSPAALKRTFAVLRDNVRCVVLNACYSEVQARGIAESIDCVVGMTRAIGDESAVAFAASFYQGLGYGRSIKEAFELGCGQIDLEGLGDEDVPKLVTGHKVNSDGISPTWERPTLADKEPINPRRYSLELETNQPVEQAASELASVKGNLQPNDLMELVQISRELAAQVNLEPLLQSILSKASELTDSPASSVILYNIRSGSLYFAAATGDNAAMLLEKWGEFAEHQVPVEGSIAGKVFVTGVTLVVDEVEEDSNHFGGVDQYIRRPTESMICVPLTFADERLGVMQILNKRSGNHTPRDRVLIEHFAAQAAIAIRNAKLFEDILMHMGMYASREKHIGPLVLLEELKRPAHLEKLSLMFADLRGFTQLCQLVGSPEDIQNLLSEFMCMLTDEVLAHKGIVNKFMGDGMLAIFRSGPHEESAVRCAFSIVEHFARLRQQWLEASNLSLDFLDVGVGIATDRVILGTIGSERGVRDFTAIGTAVNLAAYLESQARGGRRILVDRMTYGAVKNILDEFDGPEEFVLKKPGQEYGHPYQRFHLKSIKR